jgi:SH3-like domain-containing protein
MWRKIRDMDGTAVWVHKTMLAGKRNIIIKGKTAKIVRIDHEKDAKPLLKVEPSVVARLVECTKEWCRIQVSGRKGCIEKTSIWGVYPDEIME